MFRPQTSIIGSCLLVLAIGYDLFCIERLVKVQDLWIERLGTIVMANALVVALIGWLPRRKSRGSFLWSFVIFGSIGMTLYLYVCVLYPVQLFGLVNLSVNELTFFFWKFRALRYFDGLVSPARGSLWGITNLISVPIVAVLLSLPQLLFALCGGLFVNKVVGPGLESRRAESCEANSPGSPLDDGRLNPRAESTKTSD